MINITNHFVKVGLYRFNNFSEFDQFKGKYTHLEILPGKVPTPFSSIKAISFDIELRSKRSWTTVLRIRKSIAPGSAGLERSWAPSRTKVNIELMQWAEVTT